MLYSVMDIKDTWFKREQGEKKIYSESLLFYRIKQILNDAGFDVVKKCPAKDGHLTSAPYYIRDRKGRFCLHDEYYQIRSLTDVFNSFEDIKLKYHD